MRHDNASRQKRAPVVVWTPASVDIGVFGVGLDASENIFACGFVKTSAPNATDHEMAVVKLSPNGMALWTSKITTANGRLGCDDLKVDSRGDVYVIGVYDGTIGLGGSESRTSVAPTGYQDRFFAKFAGANGQRQWARSFSAAGYYRIALAPNSTDGLVIEVKADLPVNFGGGPIMGNHLLRYSAATGAYVASRSLGDLDQGNVLLLSDTGDFFAGGSQSLSRLAPP